MASSGRATLHYGAHQILRGFVSGRLSVAKGKVHIPVARRIVWLMANFFRSNRGECVRQGCAENCAN